MNNENELEKALLNLSAKSGMSMVDVAKAAVRLIGMTPTPPKATPYDPTGYYTVPSLALKWGCCTKYIYDRISRGELQATHIGKMWHIPERAVVEFETARLNS